MELFDISTTVLYRLAVLAAFVLASAALTFLARWLKVKADVAKADFLSQLSGSQRFALDTAITTAVQAAEQSVKTGDAKLAYVKGLALQAAHKLGIELTDGQLTALIESAVYDLRQLQTS